jgi:c-di-GMP-binding flagellar brake protein YcgR
LTGAAEFLSGSGIAIGARADVRIDAGLYKGHYPSRVEELAVDAVGLAHPMLRGVLLPIYRDMTFQLLVEAERVPLLMRATALRSDLRGVVPLLWGRVTGEIERIQRRRFLRVPWMREVFLFPLDLEVRSPLEGRWFPALALDLSLGGMRVRVQQNRGYEKGDRFLVRIPLFPGESWMVGKLMRLTVDAAVPGIDAGVEFESVTRQTEKVLLDLIRQQERVGR